METWSSMPKLRINIPRCISDFILSNSSSAMIGRGTKPLSSFCFCCNERFHFTGGWLSYWFDYVVVTLFRLTLGLSASAGLSGRTLSLFSLDVKCWLRASLFRSSCCFSFCGCKEHDEVGVVCMFLVSLRQLRDIPPFDSSYNLLGPGMLQFRDKVRRDSARKICRICPKLGKGRWVCSCRNAQAPIGIDGLGGSCLLWGLLCLSCQ